MEKSVGEKLKEYRKQRQWTQEELAKQLNVTRQAVSNWERDKTLPDVYLLKEIAAVFDMTLDQYMENTKQLAVFFWRLWQRSYSIWWSAASQIT